MSDVLRRSCQFNPVSEVIVRLRYLCVCSHVFLFCPTEARAFHVGKPGDVVLRALKNSIVKG